MSGSEKWDSTEPVSSVGFPDYRPQIPRVAIKACDSPSERQEIGTVHFRDFPP